MTPAQKAKRTKLEKQYWAEYDQAVEEASKEFYDFCKTLYPERDAKIAAAEAKMDEIIAAAQAEFFETRTRIMDEFEMSVMLPLEFKELGYGNKNRL
jgi:F0F1-type ATP synthase membrane subunit b/b'